MAAVEVRAAPPASAATVLRVSGATERLVPRSHRGVVGRSRVRVGLSSGRAAPRSSMVRRSPSPRWARATMENLGKISETTMAPSRVPAPAPTLAQAKMPSSTTPTPGKMVTSPPSATRWRPTTSTKMRRRPKCKRRGLVVQVVPAVVPRLLLQQATPPLTRLSHRLRRRPNRLKWVWSRRRKRPRRKWLR